MARLWTPIANAFDAYHRRIVVEPNAYYEHIWRLIHIHESLIVTLASAAATRLFFYWMDKPGTIEDEDSRKRQIQRLITGLTTDDPSDPPQNDLRGCLKSGSINEWINLLSITTKVKLSIDDPFLISLKEYLETIPDKQKSSQLSFLDDWSRIAPVPLNHKEEGISRIKRFQAINELRNKLAHVPISGRLLPLLHKNLRKELLLLLTEEDSCLDNETISDYKTISAITKKWHSPLCGKIVNKYAYVEGSNFGASSKDELKCDNVCWQWQSNSSSSPIKWKASPFVCFDDELKVSLLFRLPNLSYDLDVLEGEYHRFAAEVEPVQKLNVSVEDIKPWLPSLPIIDETSVNTDDSELQQGEQVRTQAENAFKSGDYENAVKYYELIANKYPVKYSDVAKSRHGAALWRVANFSKKLMVEERRDMFRKAITMLDEATNHTDIDYKAESYYQKSKALWHLSKIDEDVQKAQDKQDSIDAIKTALLITLEQKYINWYEWLIGKD